jgi:hypothetical protein
MEAEGLKTYTQLAKQLGMNPDRIRQAMRILALPDPVKSQTASLGPVVGRRGITEKDLLKIARRPGTRAQIRAFRAVVKRKGIALTPDGHGVKVTLQT